MYILYKRWDGLTMSRKYVMKIKNVKYNHSFCRNTPRKRIWTASNLNFINTFLIFSRNKKERFRFRHWCWCSPKTSPLIYLRYFISEWIAFILRQNNPFYKNFRTRGLHAVPTLTCYVPSFYSKYLITKGHNSKTKAFKNMSLDLQLHLVKINFSSLVLISLILLE